MQPGYRELLAGDAQAVTALRLAVIETDPAAFSVTLEQERAASTATLAAVLDHMQRADDRIAIGAFAPELVGMIGAEYAGAGDVRLWGMNVLQAHRRRGIATALLNRVIEFARDIDAAQRLVLQVATAASAAQQCYRKAGFIVLDGESHSAPGALSMACPLR